MITMMRLTRSRHAGAQVVHYEVRVSIVLKASMKRLYAESLPINLKVQFKGKIILILYHLHNKAVMFGCIYNAKT